MIYVMLMACGVDGAAETDGGSPGVSLEPAAATISADELVLGYCQAPGDDPDGCCALYMGCDTTNKPTCMSPPAGTCYEIMCQSSAGGWFATGACRPLPPVAAGPG